MADGQLTEPAYTSLAGPIAPIDMIFGHRYPIARGLPHMTHRSGFTQPLLAVSLRRGGFATVVVRRRPDFFDLWAIAAKTPLGPAAIAALVADHFPPGIGGGLLADELLDVIPPLEDPRVPAMARPARPGPPQFV